jgi:hypothetical protein
MVEITTSYFLIALTVTITAGLATGFGSPLICVSKNRTSSASAC